MNHQRLSEVLRFGAAARELSWGTGLTETAATLAYQAAHGENTALHALADLLGESEHPAEEFVRRAADGEGEDNSIRPIMHEHESVRVPHPTGRPAVNFAPYSFVVLPKTRDGGQLSPGRAAVKLQYHNHPDGHFFNLTLRATDEKASRTFLLPVSADQVRDYAHRLREIDPTDEINEGDANHILTTLDHTHPQPTEHFAKSVRRAVLPHSETTASFLNLLQSNPHDLLDTSGNNNNRLIAADHFDEIGREHEAATLRSTDPIGIHGDRIWSGNPRSLPEVAREYIRSALWSSADEHGHPLDDDYGIGDLHPSAVAKMHADAVQFHEKHGKDTDPADLFGHYFWLSRNGHGAGFDDRPEHFGDGRSLRLHEKAQRAGEADLYVGEDGQIYHHPM